MTAGSGSIPSQSPSSMLELLVSGRSQSDGATAVDGAKAAAAATVPAAAHRPLSSTPKQLSRSGESSLGPNFARSCFDLGFHCLCGNSQFLKANPAPTPQSHRAVWLAATSPSLSISPSTITPGPRSTTRQRGAVSTNSSSSSYSPPTRPPTATTDPHTTCTAATATTTTVVR